MEGLAEALMEQSPGGYGSEVGDLKGAPGELFEKELEVHIHNPKVQIAW